MSSLAAIPIGATEEQEEHRFRETLDELLSVISDNTLDTNGKISSLLEIGRCYLDMDSGMLASAMGDSLELISVSGQYAQAYKPGDKLELNGTICEQVIETDHVVAVHNMPKNGSYAQYDSQEAPQNAYIGTQLLTTNGPLGIACYQSKNARPSSFTDQDKKLVTLVTNWIGAILGNEEQIEFLSLQNDYYQSLFESVPAMLMLCNQDGLVLSASSRLSLELGVDPLTIPGRACEYFFIDDNAEQVSDALKIGEVKHLPLTMRYDNGKTLEVELSSSIKHIGSMQGIRMIVLSDVSERNQAVREAEEQTKQLELNNESLNQFAYIASHDLQEPLRKIQQFSHFLEEDLGDAMTDEGQYHLSVIVNAATRASTLIQDLLEFSSAAKGKINRVDIDLNLLVEAVCSELELRIEEANATVLASDLPTITGDMSLVQQLFTNLIGNSIKYSDANRAPIIKVESVVIGDKRAINIIDNGIGFDGADAEKAFEPFNRLHKEKSYTGNGIGLSICSTVCEKHNWRLSAQSQPNNGSTFTITLDSDE